MKKKLFFGADHGGFQLKEILLKQQENYPDFEFKDLGCFSKESTDYPTWAKAVVERVSRGEGVGILVCGSGIGMGITANKFKGVRAVTAWDETSARLSRQHNDANVLCLGQRLLGETLALEVFKVFLNTKFDGGRHQKRLDIIAGLEK